MPQPTSFGDQLRRYRELAGLTQEQLAEQAGLTANAIGALERGERRRPYPHTVQLLATALKLSEEQRAALIATLQRRPVSVASQLPASSMPQPPAPGLPTYPTPFVGREAEMVAVCRRLEHSEARLLTLTGPGGTGKTRLSLQVAAALLDTFPDGVFFVSLAPIRDPDLIPSAIAQTLGIKETGTEPLLDAIKAYLRDKHLLLVLDNFEHLLDAAPLVGQLLQAAPALRVLVTSRELLHVYGEQAFPVLPLSLPDAARLPSLESVSQYEAVRLFIERAQAVQPTFQVTNENAPAVAEICHRLDGLPLAIELAAARIRLLPPQALLARLEKRLPLLTGGARDLPTRQQTLRSTIDWSYNSLPLAEQTLFRRLAVFVGSRSLQAVEAICNAQGDLQIDVLDGLQSLLDKSLLYQKSEVGGEPSFAMLETIWEYALERLEESGEAETLRQQHAGYYLALVEQAEPELKGPQQVMWLDQLEVEHDNIRAALRWALERGEAEVALRLCAAAWWFWYVRSHLSEGRRWLEKALASRTEVAGSIRAKALNGAGVLARNQADYDQAAVLLSESLSLHRKEGNTRGVADALNNLGTVALDQGDDAQAAALFTESLELRRDQNDRWGVALALNNVAVATSREGDYARAAALCEESLALFRELKDKRGIAMVLSNLGLAVQGQGDPERAMALYEESLNLYRQTADRRGVAYLLSRMGEVARLQGNDTRAVELYKESLTLYQESGDRSGVVGCLDGLSGVAAARGRLEDAARLVGAAEGLRKAIGASLQSSDPTMYEQHLSTLRTELGAQTFAALRKEGQSMTLDDAVAYALALNIYGDGQNE